MGYVLDVDMLMLGIVLHVSVWFLKLLVPLLDNIMPLPVALVIAGRAYPPPHASPREYLLTGRTIQSPPEGDLQRTSLPLLS